MSANLIGQTLDRYRITALLGEGGMGAVYRAQDGMLLRDVAVKVMHGQFGRQASFRERFLQEARAAARLDHPGIVKVFDFGQQELLYIVMEFVPGANLRKMLRDLRAGGRSLVLAEAVGLLRQVALALHYAHGQGVLHRDLKPDNIMLKSEPAEGLPFRPVITDLGLAKLSGAGGAATQAGTAMGTPAYMAPEQVLGQPADARSDVYSLGILLFELAAGQLPFPVQTLTDAVRYHLKEPPPRPRALRPELPETLEAVILKAIAKEPGARYADAQAFAAALAEEAPRAAGVAAPGTTSVIATGAPPASLVTQYQQSLVDVRGSSVFGQFPSLAGAVTADQVRVLSGDGSTRVVGLKPGGLSIGRTPENDLALSSAKVSSRHARVEFDGAQYRVTDLNSTNGTYLGGVKLLPGVPEAWPPDKPLKVGDFYLRLERGAAPAAATGALPSTLNPSLVRSSPGTGRVGLFVDTGQMAVEPGKSAALPVIVLNQGGVVDHFKVTVEGVPAAWVTAPPPLQLMPGAQQEVRVVVQPPLASNTRAGRHVLKVRAASQDAPDQAAEARVTLTVGGFAKFAAELRPQKAPAGKPLRVTVANHGNMPATFVVEPQDAGDELQFRPAQAQVKVEPGQTGAAEFRGQTRRLRLVGGERTHMLAARVGLEGAEPQMLNGQLVSRGLVPVWAPPLALMLCLALGAAAALAYQQWTEPMGTPTVAVAAQATAGAAQTAFLALTQTAVWLAADDDGDGISNQREQQIGTSLTAFDSDGDGWSDGEEVNARGTNPLDPDTDDDGAPDSLDPDPGAAPTATPTLVATVTSSPTPSSTPSATLTTTATLALGPSVSLSFSPATVAAGTTGQLNIALTNSNVTALVGVGFNLDLPSGLQVPSPPASSQCNGAVSVTAARVTLRGGALPGGGNCTIVVTVSSSTVGAYSVSMPVGAVATTNGGSNSSTANTTLNVTAQPTVGFTSATYSANEGDGTVTINATLSNPASTNVTVTFATANGTATGVNGACPSSPTAAEDFSQVNGTLTFVAGSTTPQAALTVAICNDNAGEPDETVSLILSSPSANATLGTSAATLTISANDTPTISFAASTFNAGEASSMFPITMTLSNPASTVVTVNYATANGTATGVAGACPGSPGAGQDYVITSGTLSFPAGASTAILSVAICNDFTNELDETVNLSLSSPSANATLGTSTAVLTIIDDDISTPTAQPPPTLLPTVTPIPTPTVAGP